MKQIRVIIAEQNPELILKMEEIFGQDKNFHVVSVIKDGKNLIEQIRDKEPEIVILSKDLPNSRESHKKGLDFCGFINGEFPNIIIIATASFEGDNDIRTAMRLGARDFISEPEFSTRLISSCVDLVSSIRKYDDISKGKLGQVFSLVSATGGSGRTVLTQNLSVFTADKTSKQDRKVLILDYDIDFGDISYLSGIKPQRTLFELVDVSELDEDSFMAHLSKLPDSNVWILPAPKSPLYVSHILDNVDYISEVIKLARKYFDYIFIDCPSALQTLTLMSILESNEIIVISDGSLPSIKNTKILLDSLNDFLDEKTDKSIKLLVNKYDKKHCLPVNTISSKLKCDLLGFINKNDAVFMDCVNHNKLIHKDFSATDVYKNLNNIVGSLILTLEEEKETTTQKKSFLGKIFAK